MEHLFKGVSGGFVWNNHAKNHDSTRFLGRDWTWVRLDM